MLKNDLPRHVAIIMDGNGRWAKKRGKPRVFGHAKGVDAVREVVRTAGEQGVEVLTLYAFSEENWGRPETEVSFILNLLDTYIRKERDELNSNNVRFRTIGKIEKLPTKTRALIQETEKMLAGNTGLILNVALSYSGRSEIVGAVQNLAKRVKEGAIDPEEIDATMIAAHLQTADLLDPDLLIRTSGEQRISNFLLWQCAYSEFYFTDIDWPDFRKEAFLEALSTYKNRERRFGLVHSKSDSDSSISPAALC